MADQDVLDKLMNGADTSPLAMLIGGEPISQDPVMDAAQQGEFDITSHPAGFQKGFADVARDAKVAFTKAETELPAPADEPPAEESPEPPQDLPDQPAPEPEPEIPAAFHTVNAQAQEAIRRSETLEQKLLDSERQTREYFQQLSQQAQRPAEPDTTWMDEGFESVEQFNQYHQQFNAKVQAAVRAANAPILTNLAQQKFNTTIEGLKNNPDTKHFGEYFPPAEMQKFFQFVLTKYGPEYAANVDYHGELSKAYKVADYDRLVKAQAERDTKDAALAEAKKAERANDKVALRAVPKASASGTSAVKPSGGMNDLPELDPKYSMNDLAKAMKRQYRL